MRDYPRQAQVALEVYLQRGEQALEFMRGGRFDEAIKLLRLRTAAFHNFRVAIGLSETAGIKLEDNALLRETWLKANAVNADLEVEMQKAAGECQNELLQVRRTRQSIARYRSGFEERQGFVETA